MLFQTSGIAHPLTFGVVPRIPLDHAEYKNLQYKIEALLEVQQGSLVDEVNKISLGDPRK